MTALHDNTFRAIAELMHTSIGLSFAAHKKPLVASRLAPRLQRLGFDGFEDYLALIAGNDDQGEFQVAVDLLTTNETYFFREPAHYELLEQELARKRPASLRVWSAASSFGDEAYSTAMLLADLQTQGRIGDDWSILGTDISDRVLRSASQAIYPQERLRNVSPERLKRYCWRGEGEAEGLSQIQPKLREHVRFGQLNLCVPIDNIGPFDVVFLRNVLIYFERALQDRALGLFREALCHRGFLGLGSKESLRFSAHTDAFEDFVPLQRIYRKKSSA